jgi:signal transduction histidine kinase
MLIQIKCRDFGPGIKATDLANLFKPYSRQAPDSNNDSHGLGLFVCNRIAENMKGKLSVESTVNEGSEFTFSFKAERLEQDT